MHHAYINMYILVLHINYFFNFCHLFYSIKSGTVKIWNYLPFFFFTHWTFPANSTLNSYRLLASFLRGRKRFIAPRNNAFVAPLSLGDVWPSLGARVPITQRYSAKKARYSHNRAAVYSGWPESSS